MQQGADLVTGAVTVHAAENVVVDVLDGDVEILDDLILIRDEVDELVVHDFGVEVVQADPADALDLHKLPQQQRKTRLAIDVQTPAGDVLRDDDQLFDAERREILRLLHDGIERTAAVAAADGGDGAEGAPVVAPLGDAQIRPARTGRDHAADLLNGAALVAEIQGPAAVHHVLDGLTDLAEAARAEHTVHLRKALEDVVFVPLRETAGHEDLFQAARLFHLGELQDLVDRLALGGVDEAAGVDDRNVAAVPLADHVMAR